MKKLLVLLLAVLLIMLPVIAVSATSTADVTVSSATAQKGDTVTLMISVSNCTEAKSIYIVPEYDDQVLDIVSGSWLISGMLADDWSEAFGDAAITFSANTDINTDIFELVFKVKDNAQVGSVADVSCEIVIKTMNGQQEVDVDFNLTGGSVTVICPHANTVNVPETPAGATTVGYTAGVYCNDCSKFISGHAEIPATGDANVPKIVVSSASGTAGSSVKLAVELENNPGIAWLALSLNYDESIFTSVTVENGTLISDLDKGLNLVWSDDADVTGDGVLCTVTFDLAEGMTAGEYDISAVFYEAFDYKDNEITFTVVKGILTVVDFTYGDANGDGKINGRDVLLLRQYMANYDFATGTSSVEAAAGADANGDGKINGRDVLLMRQYMANYDFSTGTSSIVLGPQK